MTEDRILAQIETLLEKHHEDRTTVRERADVERLRAAE